MKHRIPLSAVMVALLFAGLGACADGTPPAPSPSGAGSVSGAPSAGTEPPPGTTFPLVHGSSTGGTALGPPVTTPPSSPPALPPRPDPAPPTSTVGDRQPRSDVLGVHAGLGRRSDAVGAAQDLGVGWVRVNTTVDGTSGGAVDTYRRWLDAGFNLVITLNNVDLAAIDTTYGTPKEYVHAGFPTTDPARLREDVSDLIGPLAPYLDGGRQVIVQVENEVGDVRNGGAGNIYWRGTTDQYLALERVVYDSVKQIDTRFGVSLSGLTSSAVDGLIDAASPVHGYQTSRVDRWLTEGRYDAIDLHFYGCTAQISAGARWAAASLPAGKYWISTENAGPTPMCSSTFSDWRSDPSRFEDVKAAQVRDRSAACVDGDARVCLWFSLFNLDGEVDTFNHLGLLGTDGAKTPAYDAYKQFIA